MRKVVMFTGAAGAGKDTAADAVMSLIPGCCDLKFARALKEICCMLFGWDIHKLTDDLEYKQEQAFYPDGEPVMTKDDGTPLTRREIMQFIGTDLFRDQVRDDVWVRSALEEMDRTERLKGVPTAWVLTDTRFENEFELVQAKADHLLVVQLQRSGWEIDEADHASERGWMTIPADEIIIAPSGALTEIAESAVAMTRGFLAS